MIRIIINLVLWVRTFNVDWQAVTNASTVSAAFLTFWVALITYRISKSSKVIALESKQIAAESRELAEKAYNLEHEEPWKLTPIADKEGYWILERVHRKFATIYGYCVWSNTDWDIMASGGRVRELVPNEIKFNDFGEGPNRCFFRGTKVIIKLPEVPIGSTLELYFHTHSSEEIAYKALNYRGLVRETHDIHSSGAISWEAPIY